jgi:hypothetical protein
MSSGGGGNQTTKVEPPAYQLPYLNKGLQQAGALYNQGGTVVPFSPQTETAMQLTENRALAGSPVTRAGQDYATKSLQGGFMGSNPYLDATFNRAALGTQNQLASEFARSGRNIGASEPLRAQQLGDLATSVYGGAYENERNRMQGVLPYVSPLAEADYSDYGHLAGVGSQVEGLASQYANAPGANLDQYLSRVRGTDYGQNQIAPAMQRNRLGGAAGGAMAGSTFGPWGTLIGGALGGILG